MAPPASAGAGLWDEEADRALEYTDNISAGMPAPTALCSGAAIHVPDPNNQNTSNWGNNNVTVAFNATDPNGTINNASSYISQVGGGSYNTQVHQAVGNVFTLSAATGTYAFRAYFKSIAGPSWIRFYVYDGGNTALGAWFDIAGVTVGTHITGSNTTLTCAVAISAGNGYTQVSFAGNVSVDAPNVLIYIDLVDGNGTGVSTLSQQIDAWQISP